MTKILSVRQKTVWSDKLFSFRLNRPDGFRFEAGQFVRLGLVPKNLFAYSSDDDEPIFRPYSLVSSPYDDCLEFFSVVVPDGAFTSKLQYLQVGDTLLLDETPYGFLTLSRYQEPPPKDLWLLATGTGLAPFLSMLGDLSTWERYQHIILAYSASVERDLAYLQTITDLSRQFLALTDHKPTFCFVPIVTQETSTLPNALNQRLPLLIADGSLEKQAGRALDKTSHIMLCGNPQMVEDTKEALKQQGLTMNRRGVGNIAVENYW